MTVGLRQPSGVARSAERITGLVCRTQAPVLLIGGRASDREAVARHLHEAGRIPASPFFALDEPSLQEVCMRTLLRGIGWLAPATIYVDRAEALEGCTCALLAAVAKRSRQAGGGSYLMGAVRLMAGVRSLVCVHPSVLHAVDVVRIQVGIVDDSLRPLHGAPRRAVWEG